MASVISINVGLPQDVSWEGRVVHTAIWKTAVRGRVMARRLNLDGDGQGDLAGHGGEHRAVMVYQMDSYRYWERVLQREDFQFGQFGENFTIDGLPDDEVCIGDRYRIGSAVFEVTQPRVTCYRVGIRMNNPQMPALLISHKRPGFYFRVIEEGEVGAGDEIVKVAEGPEHVTVAEVDALLYLPGHPRQRLESALRVPALSAGWRASLEALVAADGHDGNAGLAPSAAPPMAWTGFRPLRIADIRRECFDVLSFVLEAQDETGLPSALPGQFLVFRFRLDGASGPVLRSYSISGSQPGGTFRVSIKLGEGVGSHCWHEHMKIGDLVDVSAPRGDFTLAAGDNPIVFLSAGIGATPVLAMLHSLADRDEPSTREVWWCYGARNGREHPFADEVRNLLRKLGHSHSLIAYSKPEEGDLPGKDFDSTGHLDLASLQKLDVPARAEFYLCGPTSFLEELTSGLRAWGVPPSRIHSEIFGAGSSLTPGISSAPLPPPHQPAGVPGTGPNISFARSNLTVPWNPRFGSLLEFAEACDVPVRWACRAGVCHTCESGLIDGKISYAPKPLDPPEGGNILICCSKPSSTLELDL